MLTFKISEMKQLFVITRSWTNGGSLDLEVKKHRCQVIGISVEVAWGDNRLVRGLTGRAFVSVKATRPGMEKTVWPGPEGRRIFP